MKRTICAMLVVLHLTACSSMRQVPYEPGTPPTPPVERDDSNYPDAWTTAKVVLGLAAIIALIAAASRSSSSSLAPSFGFPTQGR